MAQFSDNEALQKGMRDYYHQGQGFEMLSSEVLMNKAYARIEAVLTGTAPDLAELEAEAAAEAEAEAAEMVEDGEETETAVTETTPDTEAEIEETAEPEAVAVSADEDVKEDEAE